MKPSPTYLPTSLKGYYEILTISWSTGNLAMEYPRDGFIAPSCWCMGQRLWHHSLGLLSSPLSVSNRWSNPKNASLYLDWLISHVLAFPCLLSVGKLDNVWKISFKKKIRNKLTQLWFFLNFLFLRIPQTAVWRVHSQFILVACIASHCGQEVIIYSSWLLLLALSFHPFELNFIPYRLFCICKLHSPLYHQTKGRKENL